MRRGARLLLQLRPYTLLFVTNIVATLVASVMDGATFVLLIPFLRALFGQQALPATGTSGVEDVLAKIAGPFLAAGGGAPRPPPPIRRLSVWGPLRPETWLPNPPRDRRNPI